MADDQYIETILARMGKSPWHRGVHSPTAVTTPTPVDGVGVAPSADPSTGALASSIGTRASGSTPASTTPTSEAGSSPQATLSAPPVRGNKMNKSPRPYIGTRLPREPNLRTPKSRLCVLRFRVRTSCRPRCVRQVEAALRATP